MDDSLPQLDITNMSLSSDGVFMTICLAGENEERWSELWNLANGKLLYRLPGTDLSQPGFNFVPNSYGLALVESRGLSWWSIQGYDTIYAFATFI